MKRREVGTAIIPVLGSSIAIAYGGSSLAFALIAMWSMPEATPLSLAVAGWAIHALLGGVLLVAGFGTLLKSSTSRKVMLVAMVASFLYEVIRSASDFSSVAMPGLVGGRNIVVLIVLLVGILLVLAPSSARYANSSASR